MIRVARTLVLLIGWPVVMLGAVAGVTLAATLATYDLVLKTWSRP